MLEKIKKKKQILYRLTITGYISMGISLMIFLAAGSGAFRDASRNSVRVIVALFIISFVLSITLPLISYFSISKLSEEYKNTVLKELIESTIENTTYLPNDGFNYSEIYNSNIFRRSLTYVSEDKIKGMIKGVHFESCDVRTTEVSKAFKKTTDQRNKGFIGRIYKIEFPKPFKDNIVVRQPSKITEMIDNYKIVNIESVTFNKRLTIFSENPLYVFYVITPVVIEKLIELDKIYNGKISFSFYENNIYVAIDNKEDSFDLKTNQPIDEDPLKDLLLELEDIKNLISFLVTDNNLFK